MRRGDVWTYEPVTTRPQPRLRLIIYAQALIDADARIVLSLPVAENDDPESLLTPRIGELGWALATHIERTLVSRLGEKIGEATDEELDAVAIALRAAMDLP